MRTDSDSLTQSRTADTISKWPSHLVIVRHAESERNIWKEIATAKGELVYGGKVRDMDVPLTPYGERQAVATGEGLVVEHKFDRVFVSPFKRTIETARLMIEQFPHPVEVIEDERLREIDFGVLDGLTKHGIADITRTRRQSSQVTAFSREGTARRGDSFRLADYPSSRMCRSSTAFLWVSESNSA